MIHLKRLLGMISGSKHILSDDSILLVPGPAAFHFFGVEYVLTAGQVGKFASTIYWFFATN